jgi:hypothetical protein
VLAILALVFWLVGSAVFANWKRGVNYPTRSFAVGLLTTLSEVSFAALAIWVIVRG